MLNDEEKKVLASLVEKHIDDIKEDEAKIIQLDHPAFLSGEIKYEEFLKKLLEKLK
ncbi:hypothetical protein ACFLZ7_04185 [Nanoarchaeota archaeon]